MQRHAREKLERAVQLLHAAAHCAGQVSSVHAAIFNQRLRHGVEDEAARGLQRLVYRHHTHSAPSSGTLRFVRMGRVEVYLR